MNDVDWLVDYLSQVFKGPTWQTPILDFIDDNCYMFDNTEENRLEYTPVYNQFCALLERLLEEHLRKIGISNEDFMLVMESLSDDSDLHKLVTQYVLAIDDMTVFKKMMARRNAELNLEAIEHLLSSGKGAPSIGSISLTNPRFPADIRRPYTNKDDDELSEAIRLSNALSNKLTMDMDADEAAQLERALQVSLYESELERARKELELMELEAAIAASLALELERSKRLAALQNEALKDSQKSEALFSASVSNTITSNGDALSNSLSSPIAASSKAENDAAAALVALANTLIGASAPSSAESTASQSDTPRSGRKPMFSAFRERMGAIASKLRRSNASNGDATTAEAASDTSDTPAPSPVSPAAPESTAATATATPSILQSPEFAASSPDAAPISPVSVGSPVPVPPTPASTPMFSALPPSRATIPSLPSVSVGAASPLSDGGAVTGRSTKLPPLLSPLAPPTKDRPVLDISVGIGASGSSAASGTSSLLQQQQERAKLLSEQLHSEPSSSSSKNQISEEEMRRRQQHLLAARDAILQKRKMNRSAQLQGLGGFHPIR